MAIGVRLIGLPPRLGSMYVRGIGVGISPSLILLAKRFCVIRKMHKHKSEKCFFRIVNDFDKDDKRRLVKTGAKLVLIYDL